VSTAEVARLGGKIAADIGFLGLADCNQLIPYGGSQCGVWADIANSLMANLVQIFQCIDQHDHVISNRAVIGAPLSQLIVMSRKPTASL
jgi:hypothetical protein